EAWEYFKWRREESQSHALDVYCNHVLISNGADPQAVPMILEGLDNDEKIELLRQNELDYSQVPSWQRRGASVYVNQQNRTPGHLVAALHLPAPAAYEESLKRLAAA